MLDFDSEDIDGMDDDAGDEEEPLPIGHWQPPHHTIYTWWTHPKKAMATRQRRMTPPRSNPSAGISGAALSLAKAKAVTPAHEIIALQTVPKTTTIPSSKI